MGKNLMLNRYLDMYTFSDDVDQHKLFLYNIDKNHFKYINQSFSHSSIMSLVVGCISEPW